MRKLIVAAFITLDGVMQAPGGPQEDTSGGFSHGGWIPPLADEAFGQAMQTLFSQPFELLLGRRTYDIFAGYWPHVEYQSDDRSLADLFNRVPKHVATHHPGSLDWHNSHGLGADVAGAVRALKQQDGDVLLTQGSGELVRQLLAAGLVDELRLLIHPLLLGRGKRLFGDDAQAAAFELVESATTPKGVLLAHYVRSGEVRTGSF
ncbi:dihydrofolate reductase family protein [Pseudomonas sichuanensis]|uniref:dihydrofolate reductase family protein n=1 Tax=Pseudomonas sichuanensis TaxID=2213015 RepID=UPI00244A7F56|nr:dihydrofolate reductase family protein [Pseudomonas sichuanensis]MDH0733504.1 dihydrofolate reductase family protein [Pseudomonas sichuanensis]MDH1585474.1 dihydrofolate reductase family protein [Pseudomonas sichuanensis]MDH1594281.1 dihydrofolate reductase family protein [Pseudomonas sichuanensis]MDH1599090.1 dihydrofolate reductase family protein [Pseudomonas sichuanensis]